VDGVAPAWHEGGHDEGAGEGAQARGGPGDVENAGGRGHRGAGAATAAAAFRGAAGAAAAAEAIEAGGGAAAAEHQYKDWDSESVISRWPLVPAIFVLLLILGVGLAPLWSSLTPVSYYGSR
jgi:hypothetical protein